MKTNTFTVKRKVPLALKLMPLAIIAVAVPFLGGPSGPDNIDEPPAYPDAKN